MATINYRDAAATMRAALAREEEAYKRGSGPESSDRVVEAARRIKALKRALGGAK